MRRKGVFGMTLHQKNFRTPVASLQAEIINHRIVLEQIGLGVCFFDGDRRIILSNRRYAEMYGVSPDAIRPGTSLDEVAALRFASGACPQVTREEYLAWCDEVNNGSEPRVWTASLQDGRTIRIYHQPMPGGGWVATHEDVTAHVRTEGQLHATRASLLEADMERANAAKRIAHLLTHDAVTGLPNRSAFAKKLAAAFEGAAASRDPFAVLCIDLDYFQGVNEFFGQAVGDSLLQAVAQRLQAVADGAFIARTGGDEFIVIAQTGEQPLAATSLAEQFQDALAGDLEIEGQRMRIGLSVGIAVYPTDGEDETTLLGNADAALRRAKAEGRGTFRFFDANTDARQRERAALQRDLRSVLKEGELLVYYQPLAQITGEPYGFEALVRWRHPTRGLLLPGAFISLAEESGLICDIGNWVLREACREAASWKRPLKISVNVSPLQFQYPFSLPGLVASVLAETGLDPSRLELEITEGVVIADPTRALSILREIKALGVGFAMDDFGTGYSSLASLQSFPFDKIKIDRQFISILGENENSAAIVRAILGLGQNLGIPVIAEGVETEEQRTVLKREGCAEIQGYLIGKPLPIESYASLTS
jgi:diguanylate cyclase (GGDEF)-like protein